MNTPENKLFGRIPYSILIRSTWALTLIGMLIFAGLFVYVANTKMPDTKELENPKFEESTLVYSEDGVVLDRYFQRNRQWVKFDDISPNVINALLATEDHRFFDHSGIDAKGLARAIAYLGSNGGASTITQQLAKQFYTGRTSSFFISRVWQKMKEWVIAVEFERRYTKEEIMAMFLNKFDFLNQANGIGSAANIYFGKDQKDLTVREAAVLVGMLKSPTLYNPTSSSERPYIRRNWVLSQMSKHQFISTEDYNNWKVEPTDISNFNRGENYSGPAPHLMSVVKKRVRDILKENNITQPGGEPFNIDTDGLKIYTTINYKYQQHALAAAQAHMKTQQEKFFKTWNEKDPWTYLENDKDRSEKEEKRQLKIRDNILTQLIESSKRYKQLRYKHLNEVINEIKAEIPKARLYGGDIKRMLNAEKDEGYLNQHVELKTFSESQKNVYTEILAGPYWKKLKTNWRELKADAKKVFNEKRKMSVYGYDGPIEVNMTPIDSIKYMENFLQIGSISMDPKTGFIKSWVGGSDYNMWKYDHVTTRRQVGSTFKPFLYTAAINNAISPCMKVRDVQHTIPAGTQFHLDEAWSPKNTRNEFSGEEYTFKEGLKRSLNSASVRLLNEIGSVRPVVQVAENMGITKGRIPEVPSIILGSPELTVLEMTSAYSTFANNGESPKPVFIDRIEHNGVVLYQENSSSRRALNENVNYAMVQLLKHAASNRSYKLKTEFGGKTGTSNDHVDGWFMGVSPNLVTGTWVGGAYNWIRFLSIEEGQGGRMARPFFIDYMQRLEADESIGFDTDATFAVPEEITITTDCDAYSASIPDSPLGDPFEEEFEEINEEIDR